MEGIIINKLTIELYQDAVDNIGAENAEIIVNPALIGLYNKDKKDYYYTFKSEDGFSFNDVKEINELFEKIEKIVETCK